MNSLEYSRAPWHHFPKTEDLFFSSLTIPAACLALSAVGTAAAGPL